MERGISREGVQRAEQVLGAEGCLAVREGRGMEAALFRKREESRPREKVWTDLRGHLETICRWGRNTCTDSVENWGELGETGQGAGRGEA